MLSGKGRRRSISAQKRLAAKKPAPKRWAPRGTGRASSATGYLIRKRRWAGFCFWRMKEGGEKQ